MSDSDDDLMPNSVLKYQHETAGFNRTNFNNTNITSYTFRNNMMASTLNMPHMHRQGYEMRGFDQRSIYYKRETSPMSLRSFPDSGAQNFRNSIYNRGMSSQRSVFNGRSGSPMSMRSIDSNASVSAADIALAFKNVKFNKYDLRLIKEAYNKFMKNRIRKRIEKRRNLKLFSKGNRQRLGEDSGEQGSDSSISSDDCRSSRIILHKDKIPKSINRPLTTYDLTQFRTSMKENDMYKDCTENIKQNYLRNMFTVNSLKHTTNHTSQENDENTSAVTLKKRFATGASFQWPSQRFNKSKVISNETSARNVITEIPRNKNDLHTPTESTKALDTDSEKEEIFSQSTVKSNSTHQSTMQHKRVLEDEESNSSNRKRSKIAISPIKENDSLCNKIDIQNNDFNFKKPKMPIRKISNVKKDSVPEILIAKSRQPLTGNLELDLPNNKNKSKQNNNYNNEQKSVVQNKELLQKTAEVIEPDHAEVTQNTTDVSMRPSFLKRKLFTQKLDIAESKNISNDNLATNSPQTKIYNTCREKNKVRKIVSSQSCLSHDVLSDDNVLDLIHKIVPPDQMNMTNATNKKELSKNNKDNNDKWDVASVISMCNNDEGSDTYTDEEIFKVSQISNKTNTKPVNKEVDKPIAVKNKMTEIKKLQPTVNNTIKLNTTDCKVVVKKLETNACSWKNDAAKSQCQNKRTAISNCVKSFWDTDFESDMEERTVTPWISKYQVNQDNATHKNDSKSTSNTNLNKGNVIKGTILTVRSFQSKGLNSSTRSDISRVSKKTDYDKKCQQKNSKTLNKTTKSSQNDEKKAKEQVVQSIKPQNNSRSKSNLSKVTNETPKSKPVPTKETKSKKQKSKEKNDCNTSRESLRLKQKKEQTEMKSNTQINNSTVHHKRGRSAKVSIEKNNDSIPQNSQIVNKKSKETSIKDVKSLKNPTIKIGNSNRTRPTPRKCNEKTQLSSSVDGSSLNISNILSRSLRVRRRNVK